MGRFLDRDDIDDALSVKLEKADDYAWIAEALAKIAWEDMSDHFKSTHGDANTIALAQVFATLALVKKENKNG